MKLHTHLASGFYCDIMPGLALSAWITTIAYLVVSQLLLKSNKYITYISQNLSLNINLNILEKVM